MQANFTETLIDFLNDREESTEWQQIVTAFGNFPSFVVQANQTEMSFDMYDLFKQEYGYREIGSEDEEYFYHQVKRQLDKSLIEFVPKINSYMAKWGDLLVRKETLEENSGATYQSASEGNTASYLQPINMTAQKQATKDTSDVSGNGTETRQRTYQALLNLSGKSNIDLMKELLGLKNIYLDALKSFDELFMQVY